MNANNQKYHSMDTRIITVAAALILSAVFFGSTAFAKDVEHHPRGRAFQATSLIGRPVTGQKGEYLGQISDLIIDEANNRVSLIVLSEVPGFGSDRIAVPFECLQRSGGQTFRIRFSKVVAQAASSGQDADLQVLRQYPADSPLYRVPEPVDPNWVAEVYRTYGYLPYWVQKGERAPSAGDSSETTKLVGTKVSASGGKVYAVVSDVTIDPSGRLDLLILTHVQGRGAHKVAVPFDTLKETPEGAPVLNVAADRLAMAPVFHRWDANRPGYDERVDRFFGLSPRWTGKQQAESAPFRWGGEAQGF